MDSVNRREFLAVAGAAALSQARDADAQGATPARMFVCMHEASSSGFDFRTAMEGYAKAGVRAVEITLPKLVEFTEKESVATARRMLQDLGLRVVSCSNQIGIPEPSAAQPKNLEDLKA